MSLEMEYGWLERRRLWRVSISKYNMDAHKVEVVENGIGRIGEASACRRAFDDKTSMSFGRISSLWIAL